MFVGLLIMTLNESKKTWLMKVVVNFESISLSILHADVSEELA